VHEKSSGVACQMLLQKRVIAQELTQNFAKDHLVIIFFYK